MKTIAPIKILVRFAQMAGIKNKTIAIMVKKFKNIPGLPNLVPSVANPEMVICSETTILHGKKEQISTIKEAIIPIVCVYFMALFGKIKEKIAPKGAILKGFEVPSGFEPLWKLLQSSA